MVQADENFVNGFNTKWEEKFHFPYSELTEAKFKYVFDIDFADGFQKSQGFPFPTTKEEFKPYFDAGFEEEYQQPPVFQTEIAGELFWTDLTKLMSATGAEFTTQLEGNYLHLIVPVGTTCLSLTFRISKLPTQLA